MKARAKQSNSSSISGNHNNGFRRNKIPSTVVWSTRIGTPAFLLQAPQKHLVNPINQISHLSVVPPPPSQRYSSGPLLIGNSSRNGDIHGSGSGGLANFCNCCYCCCEGGENTKLFRKPPNHMQDTFSQHLPSQKQGKSRRRRSHSKEKSSNSIHPKKYLFDVKKIVKCENGSKGGSKTKFVKVSSLEDTQAIRCVEFHPKGHLYAVGSNSKSLRICVYPEMSHLKEDNTPKEPKTIFKRNKHHRGSIYSLGWSPDGNLLATGSNDKTVKIARFDESGNHGELSPEVELTMHDGTVRDICFIEDLSNKASLLVSGGAGDCKIFVTDCVTATPFQALAGHSAPILSLYNWGGAMFVSGSQDKTVRLWDLRTRGCVNVITPLTNTSSSTSKSAIGSVCVDPSGRLLVTGHEDSGVVLFDIRGNRQIQCFKPHAAGTDVRSVRFSPKAYYLLSAGYDQKLMLTDLQGDLSQSLASITVGSHSDKVISGRWHPTEFSFVSTSADRTALLWALPTAN